jgi:hypothetical protein
MNLLQTQETQDSGLRTQDSGLRTRDSGLRRRVPDLGEYCQDSDSLASTPEPVDLTVEQTNRLTSEQITDQKVILAYTCGLAGLAGCIELVPLHHCTDCIIAIAALLCNTSLCNTSLCNTSLCNTSLCNISLCNTSLCNISLCNTSLCSTSNYRNGAAMHCCDN